jgi:hypothetical protein
LIDLIFAAARLSLIMWRDPMGCDRKATLLEYFIAIEIEAITATK